MSDKSNLSPDEAAASTIAAAKALSKNLLRRAQNDVDAVEKMAENKLVAGIMTQIFKDGRTGNGDRQVVITLTPEVRVRNPGGEYATVPGLSVADRDFKFNLSIPALEAAAEAIPDQTTWKLLGRVGVLPVVTEILQVEPKAAITLYDRQSNQDDQYRDSWLKPTVIGFSIGTSEMQVEVRQYRTDAHSRRIDTNGPSVEGVILLPKEPALPTGIRSGECTNIMLLYSTNHRDDYKPHAKEFGAFLRKKAAETEKRGGSGVRHGVRTAGTLEA